MKSIFYAITLLVFCGCQQQPAHFEDTFNNHIYTPDWYDADATQTVKLLSWNVEHFVDGYDDDYIDNNRENNPPANMEERRKMLAEAIKKIDADIVVLQEFESASYAERLAEEYFPELGYREFAALESRGWYMNVVVMSRIPLGVFYSYTAVNTPIIGQVDDEGNPEFQNFVNNRMWSVDVLVKPQYEFNLTGLHMKAGRGERNEQWRLGQVNMLRAQFNRFLHLDDDKNMLVVGDFNSTPESNEFKTLLGAGTSIEFIDPLAGTGINSHPADSAFWRIDHILPNTHMHKEVIPGSVQVLYPFSPDTMRTIADHLPLVVEFTTSDQ